MDKVLRQIKAQLAILNAFSDFYFSLHETVFQFQVPYVYFKYLKSWSLKDGQSRNILNNRSRIQLSRSLCPDKILLLLILCAVHEVYATSINTSPTCCVPYKVQLLETRAA